MKKMSVLILLFITMTVSASSEKQLSNPQHALEQALSAQEGKVVYIDFWASWCGPCVRSFPWMNKMQQQYQEQGFTIISINLDAVEKNAVKFLQDNPASFAVIYDNKGSIAKHFSIQGMPTSMLIDRDGNIKYRHSGFFTGKTTQYEDEIKKLLYMTATNLSNKTKRGKHESE